MNRIAFFAAVGALCLLTASCSKDEGGNAAANTGGAATNTGSGGSSVTEGSGGSSTVSGSGGTTSSGSSSGTGGFNATTVTGGATGTTSTATSTSAVTGGASTAGGSGRTTAAGGRPATGGIAGIGGAGTGGMAGVGGTSAIAGAPTSTPSVGCGKAAALKSGRASIEVPNVADKTREYILALPTNYDPNHAYKLIFAWHPWMGSAQMIASGGYYGLQKEANNEAIFVAAEGLNFTQGSQSGLGWGNSNGEDVAFYHAMLDLLRKELCIDEDRIFSTGFSFGAMFSFTLACTAESMTRAIVPMAGNTFTSGGCENGTRSVAVMAFIGLQDSLLDGHRQAVSTYAKRDGCTTTTETMNPSWCDGLSSTNLPCTCVNYQGCKDGYPVVSCEYTAGHQQAPNPGPIWDFIAQF